MTLDAKELEGRRKKEREKGKEESIYYILGEFRRRERSRENAEALDHK